MEQCENCAYYEYDEEYGEYYCGVDMDEDDYVRLWYDRKDSCKYYRNGDEYAMIRHQQNRSGSRSGGEVLS